VTIELQKKQTVVLAGHSQGAVWAQMIASEILYRDTINITDLSRLYLFGSGGFLWETDEDRMLRLVQGLEGNTIQFTNGAENYIDHHVFMGYADHQRLGRFGHPSVYIGDTTRTHTTGDVIAHDSRCISYDPNTQSVLNQCNSNWSRLESNEDVHQWTMYRDSLKKHMSMFTPLVRGEA
jgi:hypothetical protein